MSKRSAEYQLTKDNYNDDDDKNVDNSDDCKLATSEVLKNRVLLKAKRRNIQISDTSSNVFSGFKGFSSFGENSSNNGNFGFNFGSMFPTSTTSTFTFGSNNNKTSSTSTTSNKQNGSDNKNSKQSEDSTSSTSTYKISVKESIPKNDSNDKSIDEKNKKGDHKIFESTNNSTFYANLNKLNKSFSKHIHQYTLNPKSIYDFTLVCEEYISKCKKLKEISTEKFEQMDEKSTFKSNQSELFSFGNEKPSTSSSSSAVTTTEDSTKTPSTTDFSKTNSISFPFVMKNPFPIPAIEHRKVGDIADGGIDKGEYDDDQPPKVTSVEHSEEDSVYTKKCKLYYKKEENFIEKGIGFLYIKIKNGDSNSKAQLLIRADTNTGNILLNIILIESLPITKADNNKGVLLTCIPNPPIETKKSSDEAEKKTVTFLIRVKATDCDELYQNLIKYKK